MIRPKFLSCEDRRELLSCVKRQREDHGVARRANSLLLLDDGKSCIEIAQVLWKHIRTTNPIESVFATVRNRTRKTKGCLNRKTVLAMVFRLMMSAKKKWRKTSGPNRLPEVIQGIAFKDGIKQLQKAA